jgi:4-hydroxybenzoyl-CoA reductase subunit beta
MTTLPTFRLLRPTSVAEALEMRRANPESRFLAGGTDLIVNMRRGLVAPEALIDLGGIGEMQRIEAMDGGLCIGAGVTLAHLIDHTGVSAGFPVLGAAARTVAGPTHRETATIGGNLCLETRCVYYNQSEWWRRANGYCLKNGGETCHVAPTGDRCHGAFSGDLAPVLLVMGAEAEIAGPDGTRTIPLADLYADDGAAHLRLGEGTILTAVHLPPSTARRADYAKARVRGSVDFPLAGVAVALAHDGGELRSLRVAVTGTNPRPLLVAETESLAGAPLDEDAIARLEKMVRKQIQPMRNTLSPGHYRRRVAAALAGRLARRLYHQ